MTPRTLEALRDLWEADLAAAATAEHGFGSEADLSRAMGGAAIPILEVEPTRTWLWSDLHLGDPAAIASFDRPFADVVRMNAALLREWRRCVRPAEPAPTRPSLGVGHDSE